MNRTHKIFRQARPNSKNVPRFGSELPKKVVIDSGRIYLASKYFVTDLPSAVVPATRLGNILDTLEQGCPLSIPALMYLQQQGLSALHEFAQGGITYDDFRNIAAGELFMREHEAAAQRQKNEKEAKVQEAIREVQYERNRLRAEEDRRKRESDPKYIAKKKKSTA